MRIKVVTYVKKNSTAKGKKNWPACIFKYFAFYVGLVLIHCSEIRCLCSMKCFNEILQNLQYYHAL